MWFSERYTFSRGRSEVPRIFLRMRSCTCRRFVFFDVRVSIKKCPWSLVLGPWQNQEPVLTNPAPVIVAVGQRRTANGQRRITSLRSCPLSSSGARPHNVHLYSCTDQADADCAFPPRPVRPSGDRSR